jgi:hypothetical protein
MDAASNAIHEKKKRYRTIAMMDLETGTKEMSLIQMDRKPRWPVLPYMRN